MTQIALSSDHAGFELKEKIKQYLADAGHQVTDLGPSDDSRVDYPDYAQKVAESVSLGQTSRGILICGTGIGMAISANKVKGVRAASVSDLFSAEMTRKHNDLNVLCLGARVIDEELAKKLVDVFLQTDFEGGRHEVRVQKMMSLENKG